jgi:hypothetical protein
MIRVYRNTQNVEYATEILKRMRQDVRSKDFPLYLDESTLRWLNVSDAESLGAKQHIRKQTGQSDISEFIEEHLE